MSKFRKIPAKKITENPTFPLQKLANSSTSFGAEKLEFKNESAHPRKPNNQRSVSNLKDSSLSQSSLIVPPLNSRLSHQSKFILDTFNFSKSKERTEKGSRSTKKLPVFEKPANPDFFLETKLEDLLRLQQEKGLTPNIFNSFQDLFSEIISKDLKFGHMLSKIKKAYTDWESQNNTQSEVLQLQSDLEDHKKKINEEIEENKILLRRIQKISRENSDLARDLDEKTAELKALQEYLLSVTTVDIDSLPLDKVSWQVVLAENKRYSDLCEKLKKKVKSVNKKQNDLMTLFWLMKQKGFPVEELHEKIASKKNSQSSNDSGFDNKGLECFSLEPESQPKADIMPDLQLSEEDSFTDRDPVPKASDLAVSE